jgi:hypothetical protein
VQCGSFVALSQQEVTIDDIDRGVKASPHTTYFSEERAHGHNSHPCEPHRCSSCVRTCYGPMEASGQHSFMEEVNILTITMFLIFIYLFCILCIYIDILLYVVLRLLRPCSRPSIPMDASVPISTTDAAVEGSFSLGTPHIQVCITFDQFTIVISLFYGILKCFMFLCFYRMWDQAMSRNVHFRWKSHLHHTYHV